jgi:hypothetical protein
MSIPFLVIKMWRVCSSKLAENAMPVFDSPPGLIDAVELAQQRQFNVSVRLM